MKSHCKSDTVLATIAFRNRGFDMCKAQVETEDAVMGRQRTERAHRARKCNRRCVGTGQRSRQQCGWSFLENDRRQMDRPDIREDPVPIPPLPFEGARVRRERIAKQDIDNSGATVRCPGCDAIEDNKRAQAHSDLGGKRMARCLRITPQGAESLDRRSEVIKK